MFISEHEILFIQQLLQTTYVAVCLKQFQTESQYESPNYMFFSYVKLNNKRVFFPIKIYGKCYTKGGVLYKMGLYIHTQDTVLVVWVDNLTRFRTTFLHASDTLNFLKVTFLYDHTHKKIHRIFDLQNKLVVPVIDIDGPIFLSPFTFMKDVLTITDKRKGEDKLLERKRKIQMKKIKKQINEIKLLYISIFSSPPCGTLEDIENELKLCCK